ncbi:serine hydrolase [Aporhodopirellula rubra]|uniref:serine hydrolase n=1 Tax=Aporhodopirellula rubra TaxID=980271 RepID=UPI0028F3F7FD|nr:serine hydrolase [Aporhodopirellula rubra]
MLPTQTRSLTFLLERPSRVSTTNGTHPEAQVSRIAGAYGPNEKKTEFQKGNVYFLSSPYYEKAGRFPEAGGGLFSTSHDILQYGRMLANNGELNGRRYLSPESMNELRKKQTGQTDVNYSLGYHLRNGLFGHDGAYGTDLSVDPKSGMIAIFMTQCTSGAQWSARDRFLDIARRVF